MLYFMVDFPDTTTRATENMIKVIKDCYKVICFCPNDLEASDKRLYPSNFKRCKRMNYSVYFVAINNTK